MTKPVLVDTGPITAILSTSDLRHEACVAQLQSLRGPVFTCWPVVTETAWLLRTRPHAIARLLDSFANRPFTLLALGESDLQGIASILAKYRDLGIQLADAALVHLANRERIDTIFTLDRRDFGVMRGTHNRKFQLVPE